MSGDRAMRDKTDKTEKIYAFRNIIYFGVTLFCLIFRELNYFY